MVACLPYHASGIKVYEHVRIDCRKCKTYFTKRQHSSSLRIAFWGSADVNPRGSVTRTFRSLSIGFWPTLIVLPIPSVAYEYCGIDRRDYVPFANPRVFRIFRRIRQLTVSCDRGSEIVAGESQMKGHYLKTRISDLKLSPIRTGKGQDDTNQALARSWLSRPIHPILCRSDLTVADGHRRLDGLVQLGVEEVEVFVTDEDLSEADLLEISLVTDIHRESVPVADKCRAVLKYRDSKGCSGKQLAEFLNISEGTVVKYVSFEACVPAVQQALDDGIIGITTVYEISKAPADQQLDLLQARLAGTTRDELAEKLRRPKGQGKGKPQARSKRIVCQLPSGVSIVATGQKLSLDEFVLALGQAQKAAKSARSEGLDARTFAAVMSSKAKVKAALPTQPQS